MSRNSTVWVYSAIGALIYFILTTNFSEYRYEDLAIYITGLVIGWMIGYARWKVKDYNYED